MTNAHDTTDYTTIRDLTHIRIARDLLLSVQPAVIGIDGKALGDIKRQLSAWLIEIENRRTAPESETP